MSYVTYLTYSAGWNWTNVACAVGAGAVAVVDAPAALTAVGFTSAGVAAGSLAAATQSAVYGGYVASGSVFALAQSSGAAGIGVKGAVAIATAVGGTTMYANAED